MRNRHYWCLQICHRWIGPFRFFFYGNEKGEPAHIHVQRENMLAKFWLAPVALASSTRFPPKETKKRSRCLLHNTLVQSLNSRPKLAIFSLALAGQKTSQGHSLALSGQAGTRHPLCFISTKSIVVLVPSFAGDYLYAPKYHVVDVNTHQSLI